MRRIVRLAVRLGLLAGGGWLVQRARRRGGAGAAPTPGAPATSARPPTPATTPAAPAAPSMPIARPEVVEVGDLSAPGEPEVDTTVASGQTWVVPEPGGACPPTHPVKAKLRSKLYHLPGMLAYERTNPDRCYRDEAAAEADGLTRAKR